MTERENSSAALAENERVVRHPNGHLMIERLGPFPTREDVAQKLASIAKAWPVLADHAPHIDGEFDNALSDLRRMTAALLDVRDARDAEIARLRAAGAWLVEMVQRHGAPMHVERFTSDAGYEGDYVSVESGSYAGPMGHGATLWDAIDDARAALEVEP